MTGIIADGHDRPCDEGGDAELLVGRSASDCGRPGDADDATTIRLMIRGFARPAVALALAIAAVAAASAAEADEAAEAAEAQGEWRFAVAPFAVHWRYSPEHKPVWALGIERERADGMFGGISYFSNSFGQDSSYAYIGQRYLGLGGRQEAYFLWSAGLLYGYRGQYEDKVPLNHNGFSPGALVALGWMIDRNASAQINVLGDAGVMLQLNYAFR
jgi:hypothetical protein